MKDANPFPGLRPFEAGESHLFFGREAATDELLRKLRTNRFIAVVGTSGSGKSSLVRAGMLPDLYGGFMTSAGSNWRVAVFRPGDSPINALAEALTAPEVFGSNDENAGLQTAITETILRRGKQGLLEVTRQMRMASQENLLVLVDQFEELFRFRHAARGARGGEEADAFVKLLLEATRQEELPIYVVITMRSEYLGDCTRFRNLPEAINAGQYLIPRMTRDQRRKAISGPVAVGNAQMTQRLVQRLLNDVGDNPDQLPILQHAMMRTWDYWALDHKQDEAIDLPHYEATGGMAEALSRHADEAYSELANSDHQNLAQMIFKRLTGKGPDNREMRFPTKLGELSEISGAAESQVVAVIDAFRREGRSFLMPPADVSLTAESLIDISHESLIRIWQRLKQWVEDEAQSARIYCRLADTSALFRKGEAGLWRNPDLQIALDWRNRNHPNLPWAQRYNQGFKDAMAFLDRSRTAHRRRRLLIMVPSIFLPLVLIGYGIYGYIGELKREKIKLKREKITIQNEKLIIEKQKNEVEGEKIAIENELQNAKQAKQELAQGKMELVQTTKALVETTRETVAKLNQIPDENQKKEETRKLDEAAKKLNAIAAETEAELQELKDEQPVNQATSTKKVESIAATIAPPQEKHFITCGNVVRLEPQDVRSEFKPGKIYVFAQVHAPRDETLLLKWEESNGKALWQRKLKVRKNMQRGYRTYAWKTIGKPGTYFVSLYTQDQQQIGRREFTVD